MIFPVFLRSVPPIYFRESDLYHTMMNAINFVPLCNYIDAVESWLD